MREPEADHDDAALAQLLRSAGRRDEPPAEFARELRAKLHGEWQVVVAERRRARRQWQLAGTLAASVAVVAVGLGVWFYGQSGEEVARIVQTAGQVTGGPVVHAGEVLATLTDGRLALVFESGVGLRLDVDSELRIDDAGHVTLARGAAYVDAGSDAQGRRPFLMRTPLGDVQHLGTQYEVRLSDGVLQVSVREGRVDVAHEAGVAQGAAGERLRITDGNVERLILATDAADWNWIGDVAPDFAIDNRSLGEFLAWVSRETGRELIFASPAAEAEAGQIVLRGAVTGLTPDQAIDAVLATTTLQAERAQGLLTIRARE